MVISRFQINWLPTTNIYTDRFFRQSFEESLENQKLRLERDELRMLLTRFEKRIQEVRFSYFMLDY